MRKKIKKKVKKYRHGGLHSPFDAPVLIYEDIKEYLKKRKDKKFQKEKYELLDKYKDMIIGGVPEAPYRDKSEMGDMFDSKNQRFSRSYKGYPRVDVEEILNRKKGGSVKKKTVKKKTVKKKAVSSKRVKAHRGDGIAKRGRTRGRVV
tara:strand:+ start:183 stop:626 length:444 start_codon:yes stop_codon:yes gene_type:complete